MTHTTSPPHASRITHHVPRITHHAPRLLLLILLLYLLLAIGYGLASPLFEAPDEHWHYFTAQYIKDERRLPVVTEDYDPWLSQEAAQPPLYYILGALIIAPIDTGSTASYPWLNPFFYAGDASILANVNNVVHTPAEAWPWQGVTLAAHLLRLFSTLLGLGALICIYGSGRLLWPHNPRIPLLATALTAFLPQYAFLHSAITNDALVIFLASAALWQLLWLWQHPGGYGRLLLLGLTCGLAALTKNAGILLILYAIGVLFLRALRDNGWAGWRRWLGQTAVTLTPAILTASWLWLRNWQLYGDPTATEPFIRIAGGDRAYSVAQVLAESGGLLRSAVAVFGWFNILAPGWIFALWGGIVLLGLAGIGATTVRQRTAIHTTLRHPHLPTLLHARWFPALWLASWLLLVYAGLFAFMLQTPAAQGRLLFPAITPLALGLAYGLTRWRWRYLPWLTAVTTLLTSLYCLLAIVRPAYALPPQLAALPAHLTPQNQPIGSGLTLLATELTTDTAVPGDTLWLNLYWMADPVPTEAPELVVELFGRQLTRLGNYHSYHGRGLYPANLWPANTIIADRVGIRIGPAAAAPVLAPLYVRLADDTAEQSGVRIGEVAILPNQWPDSPDQTLAEIGDHIRLTAVDLSQTSVQPGDTITITVQWHAPTAPGTDLTTLLHLAQPNQPPLATGDNQPLQGQFPTRVWPAGTVLNDTYTLTIPPDLPNGRYPLWLGMYDSVTITRQPLTVNGMRQPNDVWQIGEIEVGD